MAIRSKNRRRIAVGGRPFAWYVREDDSLDLILHVASGDKRFIVTYKLGRPGDPRLAVIGREFAGMDGLGGRTRRFRCPRWEGPEGVTPGGVRRLVGWALSPGETPVEVDWRDVPVEGVGPPAD